MKCTENGELTVSHSVKSKKFKKVFNNLSYYNPSIVVFCAKERELPNTVYSLLQDFLNSVEDENYLEIPIHSTKSDKIMEQKDKYATDLFNVVLRLANGETLNDIAYHEKNRLTQL